MRPILSLAIAGFFALSLSVTALADSGSGGAQPFSANGVGTGQEIPLSPQNCQFPPISSCTVESRGTAAVVAGSYAFLATYDSVITIDYSKVVVVGAYFCAPAAGRETLTSIFVPADTITKSLTGYVCGGTASNAPHDFAGTFTITGGTGRFAGATGRGTVTATDNGLDVITSTNETGTIVYGGGGQGGDSGSGRAD